MSPCTATVVTEYEGVLAPFGGARFATRPYAELQDELAKLHTDLRLVVVSPRRISAVARALGIRPVPEIWGIDGIERYLPSKEYELASFSAEQMRGLAEADLAIDRMGLRDATEFKPGAVAFYFNHRNYAPEQLKELRRTWLELEDEFSLDFVGSVERWELRVKGFDRESVQQRLRAEFGDDHLRLTCSVNRSGNMVLRLRNAGCTVVLT